MQSITPSPPRNQLHYPTTESATIRRTCLLCLLFLFIIAGNGCATSNKSVITPRNIDAPADTTAIPAPKIQPWTFAGVPGQSIRTANYRIHTTSTNPKLVAVLPAFYESAHKIYLQFSGLQQTTPPQNNTTPNHEPPGVMDVFLFGTRQEWETFSKTLLGDRARRYVQIGRGGFSTRGSSIIYDLGYADSLKIAAHEGWHQFVQQHFKEAIPVWLDEGIAAQMEGITLHAETKETAFLPHANTDRLRQLQAALSEKRLTDLKTLLSTQPNTLLGDSDDLVLDYYADVWALSRFLTEYDKGRYAKRLKLLLQDARTGQLKTRVAATLLKNGWQNTPHDTAALSPVLIFQLYFSADLDAAQAEFMEFKNRLAGRPTAHAPQQGQPLPGQADHPHHHLHHHPQ